MTHKSFAEVSRHPIIPCARISLGTSREDKENVKPDEVRLNKPKIHVLANKGLLTKKSLNLTHNCIRVEPLVVMKEVSMLT